MRLLQELDMKCVIQTWLNQEWFGFLRRSPYHLQTEETEYPGWPRFKQYRHVVTSLRDQGPDPNGLLQFGWNDDQVLLDVSFRALSPLEINGFYWTHGPLLDDNHLCEVFFCLDKVNSKQLCISTKTRPLWFGQKLTKKGAALPACSSL